MCPQFHNKALSSEYNEGPPEEWYETQIRIFKVCNIAIQKQEPRKDKMTDVLRTSWE